MLHIKINTLLTIIYILNLPAIWQHFNINVLVQYLDVKNIYVFVQMPQFKLKEIILENILILQILGVQVNYNIIEDFIKEADENFIEESNKNERSFDFYDI